MYYVNLKQTNIKARQYQTPHQYDEQYNLYSYGKLPTKNERKTNYMWKNIYLIKRKWNQVKMMITSKKNGLKPSLFNRCRRRVKKEKSMGAPANKILMFD